MAILLPSRRRLLPLILLPALLSVAYYLSSPPSSSTSTPSHSPGYLSFLLPSRQPARIQGEGLFPDVPDVWAFLNATRDHSKRRPSWGALKGVGAKKRLRENLREDREYMISFLIGGWHNQIISAMNLIYIAHLAQRTPIVPPFSAASQLLGYLSKDLPVSEVFDLNFLRSTMGDEPIIELHELKVTDMTPERWQSVAYDGEQGFGRPLGEMVRAEEPEKEELGCWSYYNSNGRKITQDHAARIHLSYTPLPLSVFPFAPKEFQRASAPLVAQTVLSPHRYFEGVNHGTSPFDPLPASSKQIIADLALPAPALPPERSLACVESCYWINEVPERYEVRMEYTAGEGAWGQVGRFMRFQPGIVALAEGYLRGIWGVKSQDPIPPYVAVHIRRNDFAESYIALTPRHYAHSVMPVLESIKHNLGINVRHILFTTDEKDETWVNQLVDYGWHYVNHTATRTTERFGYWMPTIIDSALLSGGKGFLGVKHSTMSILAYRRTIDWNEGVGTMLDMHHKVPDEWEWDWPLDR